MFYNKVSFDLYYRRNDWIHLVKLKEMDLCRFITNYFGKAFTALERNAGIAPGHCPIKSVREIFALNRHFDFVIIAGRLSRE